MIRVSTTHIEQFRRVIETDYAREDQLIAQIKGAPFKPSWQMEAGTAWDIVLTQPAAHLQGSNCVSGKYSFKGQHVLYSFSHLLAGGGVAGPCVSPILLTQVKQTSEWDSVFGPVTVVGVADVIQGLVVQENKAKFGIIDPREYEPSLQWRFYLSLFRARCFRYNLFDFKEPTDEGYCELTDIVSFRLWPYEQLQQDCSDWLNHFLQWADDRNLLGFLDRKASAA